jgi:erythromycin esterase-like protein
MRAALQGSILVLLISCGSADAPSAATGSTATVTLAAAAHPITGSARDYDTLLSAVGSARIVLLGEATHGTHEFYAERLRITQRLAREKSFNVLALEADFDDADVLDRWASGKGSASAEEVLQTFKRFPRWMWANRDFAATLEWVRTFNRSAPPERHVRIIGLDVYGVAESVSRLPEEMAAIDAGTAERVRRELACFDRFLLDISRYSYSPVCAKNAERVWQEVSAVAKGHRGDSIFRAVQHARVIRNGEEYYREMARRSVSVWNLRDKHMIETLEAFDRHRRDGGHPARIVIWAHNSHVGDARATDMGRRKEWNIGQLVRERHRNESFIVGFSTYSGTVRAAHDWGGTDEVRQLNPAIRGSYSALFQDTGIPAFYLLLREPQIRSLLGRPRLSRAVGVIYRPLTERESHYYRTNLVEQFDAVVHIGQSTAVEPVA